MSNIKQKPTAKDLNLIYARLYETYGPSGWWPSLYGGAFEIICGAILTQNTAWRNVEKALTQMRNNSLWGWRALLNASDAELENSIRPSGYYRTKARKLKIFAKLVAEEYDYDLDRLLSLEQGQLRQKLLSIWGVGPETADDIVLYAANRPSFVIDRYTMRLVDRLGWSVGGKNYHDYKALFETLLATDLKMFQEYHGLIDIHVSRICKIKPKCKQCCLSDICISANI